MNREDIICMVQESVIDHPNDNPFDFRLCRIETIERFAALVAAAERERCAQICDHVAANAVLGTAGECARAIRNATNQQEDTKTLDT